MNRTKRTVLLALLALGALGIFGVGPAAAKPLKCPKHTHRSHHVCVQVKVKRGPQGERGPQGDRGEKGSIGATGPAGTPNGITRQELEQEVIKAIQLCIASPGLFNICNEEPARQTSPQWGELVRNEFGSPTATTGLLASNTPDSDGALVLATADGTEKAEYGTESELAGLRVADFGTVEFEEFVTDGDFAINPRNTPNIQIEVNPGVAGKTYSSLVFNPPAPSVVNAWTHVDATNGAGWYFSSSAVAAATNCSQAHECTLGEVQAAAPDAVVSLSVGMGKGRDYQFQGAVDNLAIGGHVYDFTAAGVLVN